MVIRGERRYDPGQQGRDHMVHWLNSILQHLHKAGDFPDSQQMCDSTSNKGATVTKEGQGEKMHERKKNMESEKGETARQEA